MLGEEKSREGRPRLDEGEQADEKGRSDSHLNDEDAVNLMLSQIYDIKMMLRKWCSPIRPPPSP